jgi:hypothetical protein
VIDMADRVLLQGGEAAGGGAGVGELQVRMCSMISCGI